MISSRLTCRRMMWMVKGRQSIPAERICLSRLFRASLAPLITLLPFSPSLQLLHPGG